MQLWRRWFDVKETMPLRRGRCFCDVTHSPSAGNDYLCPMLSPLSPWCFRGRDCCAGADAALMATMLPRCGGFRYGDDVDALMIVFHLFLSLRLDAFLYLKLSRGAGTMLSRG